MDNETKNMYKKIIMEDVDHFLEWLDRDLLEQYVEENNLMEGE